ncbi:sulfatase [Novipirellula caenicola]|uniref:Bifunctional sulfatase/alpha-L-rhamnosidase n=1 Tax=Novipirellula caenicola TaxID=1536901 RepID=A0ABP9VS12_9BACT
MDLLRRFSKSSRIWATLLSFACVSTALANERPNIIFLMSDDQSFYSLGCYGNEDVKTPNLDQLAAEGMVFDNHYDTTAICMASRASVMTGMLEYKTGCNFDHGPMTRDKWQQSYPMLLRANGYRTAFAGKFGFEVVDTPESKKLQLPSDDFDVWGGGPGQTSYNTRQNKSMAKYADEYPHSTLSYGAFGRDFVRDSAAKEQPFCLSISFKAPHMPATPDPRFDDVYAGKTFKKPANFGREHGTHFSKQSQQGRQYERFHSWHYSDDYDNVMAKYHQQIYAIDVAVGMIRDALEEHGASDNTVIFYTSDNGFLCGSHGYGSKVLPYEEASRVPLIVYDPRHPNRGKQLRTDSLTGNIDFAPTILAMAGITPPRNMDGRSLIPILDDPATDIHTSLPLINVWGTPATQSLAIVTKDMKYIYWGYAGDGFSPTEELYHTRKDPLELVNLAKNPEYSEAMKSMRAGYDQAVEKWKQDAVPYNRYQEYGVIFDRHAPWAEKAKRLQRGRSRE